jgi:hypothetical protein
MYADSGGRIVFHIVLAEVLRHSTNTAASKIYEC